MYQLIDAIWYLQTCGVVHRDLKPENILIEKDKETDQIKQIKVIDFGLSKIARPNEIMQESCGTPAYVAPEVLERKGYTKEVDIWTCGVIFYVLVTRALPFAAKTRDQTFELIKNAEPNYKLEAFQRFIPEC